jgi:cystathionine gamma-synthase
MEHPHLRIESAVVATGRPDRVPAAPLATPIVLTSSFHASPDGNRYLRTHGSDTIAALEQALAALEHDQASTVAFASGMAATAAVVDSLPAGSVAVVPKVGYAGSVTLWGEQAELGRLEVRSVDITDTAAVLNALPGARLLWLEAMTNPLLGIPELDVLIPAARQAGALVAVDATFPTPLNLRPLEIGADLVMHSVTKSLAGHSDVLIGALSSADPDLDARLRNRRLLNGAVPGALESYLALRGLRTFVLRMERAQANAAVLAQRLAEHPQVAWVRYPGLASDPMHERAARLFDGFGAMISFEVAGDDPASSTANADRVAVRVRLITNATSLGGVESLIERRAVHVTDASFGVPPGMMRFSVGIEHVEDLWADLAQAMDG